MHMNLLALGKVFGRFSQVFSIMLHTLFLDVCPPRKMLDNFFQQSKKLFCNILGESYILVAFHVLFSIWISNTSNEPCHIYFPCQSEKLCKKCMRGLAKRKIRMLDISSKNFIL